MKKSTDALQSVLDSGDVGACLAFFAGMSPTERQAMAKTAEAQLKTLLRDEFRTTAPGRVESNKLLPAARVAALATCSLAVLKSLGWRIVPSNDVIVRVMADRRPPWLDEFAESLLEDEHPRWQTVRALVKEDLCSRPTHDNYTLGMTQLHSGVGRSTKGNVLQELLDEPDLLENVWRLFEIEGGGEYSLAAHDKFSRGSNRWDSALVELSRRGVLPRSRLLDASLDALDRGFAQFRAGWFSAFHELLEPTLEERSARIDRYLRLLTSPIPPTVTFAIAAVEMVDRHQPLPASSLVESLQSLMLARQKTTAKAALKMLGRVATRETAASSDVVRLAAAALSHESSDVQSAAFKLIEKHGNRANSELFQTVRDAIDVVAASMRDRLTAWLAGSTGDHSSAPLTSGHGKNRPSKQSATDHNGQLASFKARAAKIPAVWRAAAGIDRGITALERGELDLTACEFDGTEVPRLVSHRAICPLNTLDELIDAALAVIEEPDNYDEIERVFDGVSRLCDQRPEDFDRRTGPLLKRARQMMRRHVPFRSAHPVANLLGVLLSWLSGQIATFQPTKLHNHAAVEYTLAGVTQSGFVSRTMPIDTPMAARAETLAIRAASGRAGVLLSAPTHVGGWIDPLVLAARAQMKQASAEADGCDEVLAMLRMAPEHRKEALSRLQGLKGEFFAALRYALGGDRITVGETPYLWIAAARARSPWNDDAKVEARHAGLGPDAAQAANPSFNIGKLNSAVPLQISLSPPAASKIDPQLLSVLLWKSTKELDLENASLSGIRSRQSIWPLAQEAFCAEGATNVAANLDWWEARWMNRAYLEPLMDPGLPLRPMTLLLLLLGLAAKDPSEAGLATDALIAAAGDGRLDIERAGTLMATLLQSGLIKAARWAKTLGQVASVSTLHSVVVCQTIGHSLRGKPASYPDDLHALVELLKELVIETNTDVDPEAKKFLGSVSGSGKLAKAAKVILSSDRQTDVNEITQIQRVAIEFRLARAERWVESTPGFV